MCPLGECITQDKEEDGEYQEEGEKEWSSDKELQCVGEGEYC